MAKKPGDSGRFRIPGPFQAQHLSLSEFIELFLAYGIHPKIHPEPIFSYTGNVLITWDRITDEQKEIWRSFCDSIILF